MKLKISLFLLFVFLTGTSFATGWGNYWPITSNNIQQYYTNAISDLLAANAERYRMCIADVTSVNVYSWNPYYSYWDGSKWVYTLYIQRNFLIPYTEDLGGYTVTTSETSWVTNVIVTMNQTNLYATNSVNVPNQYNAGSDNLHYALSMFDKQFKKIIEYPVYSYPYIANYWLDWTKADTNGLYDTYFDTPTVTNAWHWSEWPWGFLDPEHGTNWHIVTTTSYPSLFPKFDRLGNYMALVPQTNDPPIYKFFYMSSGAPRLQYGYETSPIQYTNFYAQPTNYVPNRITNDPSQGVFCSLITEKESCTNVLIAQASYGLKSWNCVFDRTYPLVITFAYTNLPYSHLAPEVAYYTNGVSNSFGALPVPTNNSSPATFLYQGNCMQVYNTLCVPYQITNLAPYYRQVEHMSGYPTNITFSNYTDYIMVGRVYHARLTSAQAQNTIGFYTLGKCASSNIPDTFSGTYFPYSEDRWFIGCYPTWYIAWNTYYKQYGKTNDMTFFYYCEKNTSQGAGTLIGGSWLDIYSDARIEEVGWEFTVPFGSSFVSGADLNAMWVWAASAGPFYDVDKLTNSSIQFRYVQSNTNMPIIFDSFDFTGSEFYPIGVDSNGWETPYGYRTVTASNISVSTSWDYFTNIFLDIHTIENTNYNRIFTNFYTESFYDETNDYDYLGDQIDFYFDAPADVYGSRADGSPNWNEAITPDMLNARKDILVDATKYWHSVANAGVLEKRILDASNVVFYTGQATLQDSNNPTLLDGYWSDTFDDMYVYFDGGVNASNVFAEAPSLHGDITYWRTDSERAYYVGEAPQGYRDVAEGHFAFGNMYYGTPVKTKIDPYYWYYSGDITAGVERVVTYGAKGTFSHRNFDWTNYVAHYGAAATNWLDYLSWSYPGNYTLVKDYSSSEPYTFTNGINWISSGYSSSTFDNDIYKDFYWDVSGIPAWNYYQSWMYDPLFPDYLYAGSYRGSWGFNIYWGTPTLIGYAEPQFVYDNEDW